MNNRSKQAHDPNAIVEVVMRRQMTKSQYYEVRATAIKKGWNVVAYLKTPSEKLFITEETTNEDDK